MAFNWIISKTLALAASVAQSIGLSRDPRSRDDLMPDVAPRFAIVTINPHDHTRCQQSQDFLMHYPHDQIIICRPDMTGMEPVTFSKTDCYHCEVERKHDYDDIHPRLLYEPEFRYCALQREHDYDNAHEHFLMACARIAWKDKDVAIFPLSNQPGMKSVATFVNGKLVLKGEFKLLCAGDIITFHNHSTDKHPFCQLDVVKIAYGGVRPTHRGRDFGERELPRLFPGAP